LLPGTWAAAHAAAENMFADAEACGRTSRRDVLSFLFLIPKKVFSMIDALLCLLDRR
jgi:hypothetical protein